MTDTESDPQSIQADWYLNEQGLLVFTAAYHLKRGYCCKNGCKHCPYGTVDKSHDDAQEKAPEC